LDSFESDSEVVGIIGSLPQEVSQINIIRVRSRQDTQRLLPDLVSRIIMPPGTSAATMVSGANDPDRGS